MPGPDVVYRDITPYKYQLTKDCCFFTAVCGFDIKAEFMELYPSGRLEIKKGYAWNGCSGPAPDTDASIKSSLPHDALYQLIRDYSLPPYAKRQADMTFRHELETRGFPKPLAWMYWKAVDLFGGMYL